MLACLHGPTWGSTALPAYPGGMRPVLAGMLSGRYWAGCLDRPPSASIPAPLREPGALRAAVESFWATNADGMYPEAVNTTVVERFTEALAF